MNLLSTLLANKHTSIAAIIYVVCKFGAQIGAIWMPSHAEQFKQSTDVLEAAAVAYGLLAAGDGSRSVSNHAETLTEIETIKKAIASGDTSLIANPPPKP